MIKLSLQQVKALHGRKSKQPCVVISGKIISVEKFKEEHPGGEEVLMEYAGLDATEAFELARHSESAKRKVLELMIGEVCSSIEKQEEQKLPPSSAVGRSDLSGGDGGDTRNRTADLSQEQDEPNRKCSLQ
ncbi:hypothetical protein FDP41_004770 [Naegleria fowleri]|uniref:Cytochrome b5 heme-binding domain-containing protein n=1 Tax=Naegleria fowleri TaxID=5763 RepID=A0A6A5BPR1_NAEFO|nr:uncharacterized protein FDP41_004770 [Naegleria fowleri]KAF0976094.1 hypothetical protein FDP41_004770 [Naegleria fowleri]CAG4717456.1 unnamed protein product [Naegleria fowleri]